jgi:ketosteroid isomerase-like protein
MSQENVERIRAGYDAFNRGDAAAWLDNFEPDAELRDIPNAPGQRFYRGHDGLREWAESMMQAFANFRFEPQEVTEIGNFILVAVRISARGLGSDVPTDMRVFHVLKQSPNDKVQSISGFMSRAEALEAVGLSEQDAHADS